MSVAIRTAVRLQDQDDVNVSLGSGVDEYALCWDNDTARFVLRAMAAGVTDHGALTGLADDDHTGYALLAGRAGGTTIYGGTAANEDITIHGTSNATRTTSYVLLQPSGGAVGIGNSNPVARLHLNTGAGASIGMIVSAFSAQTANLSEWRDSAGNVIAYVANNGTNKDSGLITAISNTLADPTSGISEGARFGFNGSSTNFYGMGLSAIRTTKYDIWFQTGAINGGGFRWYKGASEIMTLTTDGQLGVGTTTPATLLHAVSTTATADAVRNVLTIGHDTTGTAAAGFGAGALFQLESSTTAAQSAARIQALWYEATHATRKADLVLTAYDSGGEREGLRIRGAGSAAAIGFLGAPPAARVAHVADPSGGSTVDSEARSAINSILATLETFGFHATS